MEIREYTEYREEEIRRLYSAVGWTAYTEDMETLRQGFAHSLLTLAAYENGELLGILRAVGDGCTIVHVQDILVFPEKQRQGVGKALLQAVLDRYAPRLKLWRGEAGFPSANPKGGNGALCHLSPTEEQQACWIARNVVNDLSMKELDFYSYFHLYDFLHFSRKYHYHYGVLREDYSPKPSYRVLQTCAKLLDGDTVPADDLLLVPNSGTENLQVGTIVRGFRRKGAPAAAYWLADGDRGPLRSAGFNFWAVGAPIARHPVAIDLVTGKVHALPAAVVGKGLKALPLMPYPLIFADFSAFADVISLQGDLSEAKSAPGASAKQRFEA